MWAGSNGWPVSYKGERIFFAIQQGQAIGLDRLLTEVGGDTNHPSVLSQGLAILRMYIAKRDIIEQEARSGPHAGVPVGHGAPCLVPFDAPQQMRLTAILPQELEVRV